MKRDTVISESPDRPVVSVVVPTFNSGKTIGRALRSVFVQTFRNFEIVVADDASKDDTRQRVEAMADGRITFLASPEAVNRGPAATRNRALARARGQYVAFLDSDDEWFPEKLSRQVDFLKSNPRCSIVVSNAYDIAPDGQIVTTEFDSSPPNRGPEAWRLLLRYSFIETSSVMAPLALVRELGGFDNTLLVSQDQDLWIRLALSGDVGIIEEVLGKIHQLTTGHMTRNRHRAAQFMLPMIERHVEQLASRLSKHEVDEILGHRYQAIGRDLFFHRYYGLGIKLLIKASARQGNWLANGFYACHANPIGVFLKNRVRALRRPQGAVSA